MTKVERLVLAAELKALAEDREFMESIVANAGGWAEVYVEWDWPRQLQTEDER